MAGKKKKKKGAAAKKKAMRKKAVGGGVAGWSDANPAHKALHATLRRDAQYPSQTTFAQARVRKLSTLLYWFDAASGGMLRMHARNYISGMMLELIDTYELTPSAGDASQNWDDAYAACETVFLSAKTKTVADAGKALSNNYKGW